MDKLAQKFSAQEMIRANSQAEAEELERLQLQVSEYEKILQEMRKLNYKNTELAEKLELMIGENAEKIQSMKEDEQQLIGMHAENSAHCKQEGNGYACHFFTIFLI